MLQMKHERCSRLLDVGWYPEFDLAHGECALHPYDGENGDAEHLLREFGTKNRHALVVEIERIRLGVSEGQI